MTTTNPNLLRQYLETNSRLMPLRNWQARTKDGLKAGKLPVDFGWQKKDYDNETMQAHMKDGDNVGFKVGEGWGVIDYDPRNDLDDQGNMKPEAAWALWRVLNDFDLKPGDYAIVETGGGGRHVYLRIPIGYQGREKLPDVYGGGVEFKTSPRRYVVTAGSIHPGAQTEPLVARPYLWGHGSIPLSKTCDAPDALLEAFKHKAPPRHMRGTGEQTFGRFSAEQLEEVLAHLDPMDFGSTGVEDWTTFMFACHWFTGGEGREEFIEWSTGDPSYSDQAEVIRTRWDSLDGKPSGVKSGLVFKLLEKYGVPKEQWPREKTSDIFELPNVDEVPQEHETRDEEFDSSTEQKVLKRMNRDHAFVIMDGKSAILRRGFDFPNGIVKQEFSAKRDMQDLYANKQFMAFDRTGEKKQWTTEFDYWFEHPERRQYMGADFVPEEEEEFYTPAGMFLNQWLGWPFNDKDGRGIGDWDLLKEMIFKAICAEDQEKFDYLIKWMAYSVQNCRGPQRVAFVMRGEKGIGKGITANAWKDMFGYHAMQTDDDDDLFGKYNWRIGTTCAVFLDEAVWAGDKQKMGKVKTRITEPTIRIEEKFLPRRFVSNNVKIMMATNEDWAVPATQGERRFVVYDCKRHWNKGDAFYGRVKDQIWGPDTQPHRNGLRAMFYDLRNMDIGNFSPERDAVKTSGLGSQVRQGFGDVGEWWLNILRNGDLHCAFDPDPQYRKTGPLSDWDNRPVAVPMQTIRDSLDSYLGSGPRGDLTYNFKQRYISAIQKMMPETVVADKRLTLPDTQDFLTVEKNIRGAAQCFIFPPLPVMRAHLSDLFGVDFEDDELDGGYHTIETPCDNPVDVDDLV